MVIVGKTGLLLKHLAGNFAASVYELGHVGCHGAVFDAQAGRHISNGLAGSDCFANLLPPLLVQRVRQRGRTWLRVDRNGAGLGLFGQLVLLAVGNDQWDELACELLDLAGPDAVN